MFSEWNSEMALNFVPDPSQKIKVFLIKKIFSEGNT